MRIVFSLVTVSIFTLLAACGGGVQAPAADLVISSPAANAQFVTGSPITVQGTVVEGASVTVSIGTSAAVAATLQAPANGRQAWTATLTAPAVGSQTITAIATGAGIGTAEAKVTVAITQVQPFGGWQGTFLMDRTAIGQTPMQGTMIVWYGSKWFRMYFGGTTIEVHGTTDGWDLVDNDGFRMVGTYYPAGSPDSNGQPSDEAWVEYYGILDNGVFVEGHVDPE